MHRSCEQRWFGCHLPSLVKDFSQKRPWQIISEGSTRNHFNNRKDQNSSEWFSPWKTFQPFNVSKTCFIKIPSNYSRFLWGVSALLVWNSSFFLTKKVSSATCKNPSYLKTLTPKKSWSSCGIKFRICFKDSHVSQSLQNVTQWQLNMWNHLIRRKRFAFFFTIQGNSKPCGSVAHTLNANWHPEVCACISSGRVDAVSRSYVA